MESLPDAIWVDLGRRWVERAEPLIGPNGGVPDEMLQREHAHACQRCGWGWACALAREVCGTRPQYCNACVEADPQAGIVTHLHGCRGCGRVFWCVDPCGALASTCPQGMWCPACWDAARHTSVSEAIAATRMYFGVEEARVLHSDGVASMRGEVTSIGPMWPIVDSESTSFEVWEAGVDALLAEVQAQQTLAVEEVKGVASMEGEGVIVPHE